MLYRFKTYSGVVAFSYALTNFTIDAITMASLDLTSLAQSASFVTLQLKYIKEFTCPKLFARTSMSCATSVFSIVFDFATFIAML